MTLVLGWIVLPILLSVLSLGCGLLLETVSGMRLPGTLLLPGGFIVVSLAVYFAHMTDATASFQTPLAIVLALTGYAVSPPWKRFNLDRWGSGAATGVYLAFGAPVLFFGATFAGYIKLDDTATYMSMLDRATTHAYNSTGVPNSSYLRVLTEGYNFGYPLASLLPIEIGHTLLGTDQLWLWQPYLTFLALLIALGLYELTAGLIESYFLRACVAFFGAQAALMYGYALWGGVKELYNPGVLLFAACLVPRLKTGSPRQVIPLAVATAAVIGGLSVGGGVWIVPMAITGALLLFIKRGAEHAFKAIGVFLITALFLSLPILSVSNRRLNHLGKFMKGGEKGNLLHPLSAWQGGGIWWSGDFRNASTGSTLVHLLVLLVVAAAIFAAVMAWRRGRWEIVVVLATALFACLVYVSRASPWVAGKAIASSSPLILGVGLAGVALLIETARRMKDGQILAGIAAVVLAVLAGAVLYGNALQYHAVLLAPGARLAELEQIGSKFNGQGPALLTEYEPYGARHFLRGLSGEATAEIRVNYVNIRKGAPFLDQLFYTQTKAAGHAQRVAAAGTSPDTDFITLNSLLIYRTLVIRRTGSASRPPSAFKLVWSGRFYDVWQQTSNHPIILEHDSLGSQFQPVDVPSCQSVMALAKLASDNNGYLLAVERPKTIVIQYGDVKRAPKVFGYYGEPSLNIHLINPYTLHLHFQAPTAGLYDVWVGGSFSSSLTAKVDGHVTGQGTNEMEWPDNLLNFGSMQLSAGAHELDIHHSGPDLGPGTAAQQPFGVGPFVISQGTENRAITKVLPQNAHSLCGKELDWIEAVKG